MRPYIGDGYDQEYYVKGEPLISPPCRFTGRKMAHHQTAKVLREATQKPEKADEIYAEAIADRLQGWAYKDDSGDWKAFDDENGDRLPITPSTVGGLGYNLFIRLRDIVFGIAAADRDPEKPEPKKEVGADAKN